MSKEADQLYSHSAEELASMLEKAVETTERIQIEAYTALLGGLSIDQVSPEARLWYGLFLSQREAKKAATLMMHSDSTLLAS